MREWITDSGTSVTRISIHATLSSHDITNSSSAEDPSDGSRLKSIQRFTELAVKITSVVVVQQLWVVHKRDNGGWSHTDLVAVVNLGLRTVTAGGWWLPENGVTKDFVQDSGRHALAMSLDSFINDAVNLANSLSSGG